MLQNSEKTLLFIIKYLPLLFILLLSLLVTTVIELSNKNLIKENIKETSDLYMKFHNEDIKEEVEKVYKYIENEQKNSINELKKYIKQRVYEAHSIATRIYEDNKDTKSKKEILELIKTALGSIIYNKGRGYFFIDSVEGIGLLQPLNRQLENKSKLEFKDAKGYQFVKTIVQTIKDKSERYDTYYWYKGGDKLNSYKKMSFYKYFEPLNFAIGTGDYIDDFLHEMKERILKNIREIKLKQNGYIFLLNHNGKVLAHIREETIGKNFIDVEDRNKFKFVKEMITKAKSEEGSGFISYYYSLTNKNPYKKTTFIKNFDEWKWIIGTGYHDKDLNLIIKKETEKLENRYQEDYELVLLISFIATLLLLSLSIFISKILERKFVSYRNRIKMEEMEFKNLFETSDVGLAISDDMGKLIRVNKKFINMLGYDNSSDLINKHWNELSHNNFIKEENDIFNDLKEKKIEKCSIEKVYRKENGSVFDGYFTANSFYINGKIKYILSSLIDISDVKAKDNLLFQQSKMAAIGEMLANIAHQWRQPLSTISTASSGMKIQKEFGSLSDEDLISSLDIITSSSKYLSHTIDDFTEFFNPNNKEKIFINTDEVIDQSLKLVSAQFKNKEIIVIRDIDDINLEILKNELIQVLMNILNNARDALKNKEDEKFIFIKVKKEKYDLVIEIKDNAGGIPKDIIDRIFEPYFTTKHKSQGTGIGLYMVEEIIKKHMNGKIKVENEKFLYKEKEYTGAKFKIYIPINI